MELPGEPLAQPRLRRNRGGQLRHHEALRVGPGHSEAHGGPRAAVL